MRIKQYDKPNKLSKAYSEQNLPNWSLHKEEGGRKGIRLMLGRIIKRIRTTNGRTEDGNGNIWNKLRVSRVFY